MKNISQSLLSVIILAIGFVFNSCEKIIDMNITEKEKKIVINGIIRSDSIINVNVSKSLGILENETSNPYINNAEVIIYEDGDLKETLKLSSNGNYTSTFIPSQNKTYKIEVTHNIYPDASAITSIPAKVPIISIDTATTKDKYNNNNLTCKLKFNDPANEINYYWLRMFDTTSSYHYQSTYIDTDDPIVESFGGGNILFTDKLINGKEHVINFNLGYNINDSTKYKIAFCQITQDMYNYLVSYYKGNNSGPFTEPVIVYSNIKNGYGIFSGYSEDVREIKIKR